MGSSALQSPPHEKSSRVLWKREEKKLKWALAKNQMSVSKICHLSTTDMQGILKRTRYKMDEDLKEKRITWGEDEQGKYKAYLVKGGGNQNALLSW